MKKLLLFLSVIMLVNITLSAQDTLVAFKFDTPSNILTFGNTYNINNVFLRDTTFKAGPTGFTYPTGVNSDSSSLSSVSWVLGLDSMKNYYTSFSSIGYTNISVSSRHKSSNTGPKDFKLQYKVDSTGTWTDVVGGAVTCANDAFISGTLTNVPLPFVCDSQPLVYLRWIMTSNSSVGGGAIGTAGTSRIDNVFILGQLLGAIDTLPPHVDYVSVLAADSIEVKFNKAFSSATAQNTSNYTFYSGNTCTSSTLYPPDMVRLKLLVNFPAILPPDT